MLNFFTVIKLISLIPPTSPIGDRHYFIAIIYDGQE